MRKFIHDERRDQHLARHKLNCETCGATYSFNDVDELEHHYWTEHQQDRIVSCTTCSVLDNSSWSYKQILKVHGIYSVHDDHKSYTVYHG